MKRDAEAADLVKKLNETFGRPGAVKKKRVSRKTEKPKFSLKEVAKKDSDGARGRKRGGKGKGKYKRGLRRKG